jgi:preprotein translocase subunit SecA
LRDSVRLRAFGGHDPLVEYKKEGLVMFKKMESNIKADVVKVISSFLNDVKDNKQILNVTNGQNTQITDINKADVAKDIDFKDVSRNDLCPCGSGKKFKKCHGK